MPRILRRLLKIAAYCAAGVVVLLAIAVGLFRLFLPRLPEYQDEIKAWASDAIGMQVEFAGMDARWGLRGPELKFYDAELTGKDTDRRIIAANEVGVGISLLRLFRDNALVVNTVSVRDSNVDVRELAAGNWRIQGLTPDELISYIPVAADRSGAIAIIAEDLAVTVLRVGDQRPTYFEIPELIVRRDEQRTALDADVRLPEELGRLLTVAATQLRPVNGQEEPWNVVLNGDDLNLAGMSRIVREPLQPVTSGSGSIDASASILGGRVSRVSANFDLNDVALNDGEAFSADARLAFSGDDNNWLVAIDELRLVTGNGEWPLTSLRFEALAGRGDENQQYDVRASYLNLADLPLIDSWLPEPQRDWLRRAQPAGRIRNLLATVSNIDSDNPDFAVSAELERVGLVQDGKWPGVRGFSGSLRADQDGGLLAIDSKEMLLDLDDWVPEPVEIDALNGSVIWRRSGSRTTILSDSIALSNVLLDSQNSIEIVLDGDASPVVDFVSNWSISDVAAAKRFIPQNLMSEKLYRWFQDAFHSGSIPQGSTRLNGALEDFPFDNDEGRLLIEAHALNVEFEYLPTFPPSQISELDIVLDNTHLYSRRNRSTSRGNRTVNARVDIPDLREPVLSIVANSTGSLQSIHDFVSDSPIAGIFGGHLERFSVTGGATLALDLDIPIRNWREFDVSATIESSDGGFALDGLRAPFTDVSGKVTVGKDSISSEELTATFLGRPVAIELINAGPDLPEYRIIANARGTATATGLVEDLGVPLRGRLAGETEYRAQVLFPRRNEEQPTAFSVRIDSDLVGLQLDLPEPFQKSASESKRLRSGMFVIPGGERIEVLGSVDGELDYRLDFARLDDAWDFDRGMLRLGPGKADEPDVRGLHIQGRTAELRINEWLSLSRGSGSQLGAGERIRSVELDVESLYFLGQKLSQHRIQVDRSARDWLVQMQGPEIEGSIFVPYDFVPSEVLRLDMERLIFPGDDTAANVAPPPPGTGLDPRRLPEISLRTNQLGLGERRFGAVSADFKHTAQGLVASSITATEPSFTIEGSAEWLADASSSEGSTTRLDAILNSNDVAATLGRLGYEPGIEAEEMRIELGLNWSGGPRRDFLESLDGEVRVELGTGQLNEIEPGAGRVFGLMSVVALPRRLSLDFRDVFQKGFGFDSIGGTFRLDDGIAYTCDLSLVGPAADIGIIGRADLVGGSYSQTAVVSANVGNTLPVVGALVAGPQVAAAMFLITQIFNKPLKEVGQVYYDVSGPWDSPVVESGNAESFAASGQLAGCLADAG